MLGRSDVASSEGVRPHFRSKSASNLLAYLALHLGREVSRFLLQELLWPESDADKQSQNFRRAVADLRDALEPDLPRGSVVLTRRDIVCLDGAVIASDAHKFWELTEAGLLNHDEESLLDAVSLYGGPLLGPLADEWVYPYRLDFEERFSQAVELLCQIKTSKGAVKDAIRLGRAAITVAPMREDVHVALIKCYRVAGLEADAIRQFEDLEKMLDEHWGETPSRQANEALSGGTAVNHSAPPKTAVIPSQMLETTGGAVPLDSTYYIRRGADQEAENCLDRRESVVLVQGPRQSGKSSLLARALEYGRARDFAIALTDFQAMGESQLVEEDRLYRTLAHSLAKQMGVDLDIKAAWNDWLGPNMNLDTIVDQLLGTTQKPLCWGFDEADRLFGRPYAGDFFGLLRSWHNRRALDPHGHWRNFILIISHATEAHLFIADINQSPFNVGVKLPMRDFELSEVEQLGARYQLNESSSLREVHRLTNGHPYLTRRALTFLSQGGSVAELEHSAALEDGPFADHLHQILLSIVQDPAILEEVRRMLRGEPFASPTARYRLASAGIVKSHPDGKHQFRVPVYEQFLATALS